MSLLDASEQTELSYDKEKLLLVLSIFILSGKKDIIIVPEIIQRIMSLFVGIINCDDFKVSLFCLLFRRKIS